MKLRGAGQVEEEMADKAREEQLMKERAAAQEEREKLRSELEAMKTQVREKLIAEWPSPWKNDQIVNTKVMGRLAPDKEFMALNKRIRELDATVERIDGELAALHPDDPAFQVERESKPQGYMPSGR